MYKDFLLIVDTTISLCYTTTSIVHTLSLSVPKYIACIKISCWLSTHRYPYFSIIGCILHTHVEASLDCRHRSILWRQQLGILWTIHEWSGFKSSVWCKGQSTQNKMYRVN
jgi:hypothetical protein